MFMIHNFKKIYIQIKQLTYLDYVRCYNTPLQKSRNKTDKKYQKNAQNKTQEKLSETAVKNHKIAY